MGKIGRFVVAEQLRADGLAHVFGNPGTVEQGFLDALTDYPDLTYILALQEAVAVGIADGYAVATKRPAVVQLHSGVGLGNGIGMLYQAMRGHSPLVVLAGEAGLRYSGMDAHMAADLVAMAEPVTKWATQVLDSSSLLRVLRRAMKIAATPPAGPVFVALPMDVLDQETDEQILPTTRLVTNTAPTPEQLSRLAVMLRSAKRPLVIVGDGVAVSGAQVELARVVELVGAPVWAAESTEVNIAADHPQFLGWFGHMFGEDSREITSQADVVLICGTYLFPEVFPVLEGAFAPGAQVAHIDLNDYVIAQNFSVDLGLVSDPKLTLDRLGDELEATMSAQERRAAEERVAEITAAKRQSVEEQRQSDQATWNATPVSPSRFFAELAAQLPNDAIVYDEAITLSPTLRRYLVPQVPGQYFSTRGMSLGVGIPGAIGLKLAHQDRTVVAVVGDGGALYTIQALWTAAHYGIDAKFVVCSNRSYQILKDNLAEYWRERNLPARAFPPSFDLVAPEIHFDELARSMGVSGIRVEKPEEAAGAIRRALEHEGPFLLDVVVPKP